jgi:hypothetical protein
VRRGGARRAGAGATRPAGGTPSLSLPLAPLLSRPLCLLPPMNREEHGSVFRFLSCEGGRSFGVGHLGCQAVYLSLPGPSVCGVTCWAWPKLQLFLLTRMNGTGQNAFLSKIKFLARWEQTTARRLLAFIFAFIPSSELPFRPNFHY